MSRWISSQINKNDHKKLFVMDVYVTLHQNLKCHQQKDCNHILTKIPTRNLKVNKFGYSVSENILQFENV